MDAAGAGGTRLKEELLPSAHSDQSSKENAGSVSLQLGPFVVVGDEATYCLSQWIDLKQTGSGRRDKEEHDLDVEVH